MCALDVFARAKTCGGGIEAQVQPTLREDIAALNRWIAVGQVRAISAPQQQFSIIQRSGAAPSCASRPAVQTRATRKMTG